VPKMKEKLTKQERAKRLREEKRKEFLKLREEKIQEEKKRKELDLALCQSKPRVKKEKDKKRNKKLDVWSLKQAMGIDGCGAFRKPETFVSRGYSREKQIKDFVRHVLCEYWVPGFMFQCWMNQDQESQQYRAWFTCIASGGSLYKSYAKGLLTKAETHDFLYRSCRDFTINQNIWRSKIKSRGGSERLIHALVGPDRIRIMRHDEFWDGVIRFFAKNEVDKEALGELFDYISHRHYNDQAFSMKGRTLGSLMQLSNEWHREVQAKKGNTKVEWLPSSIGDDMWEENFKFDKRVYVRTWYVIELLSDKALMKEGRAMKHCVGGYMHRCKSGHSAIFSMTSEDVFEGKERHLTIEVFPSSQRIVHARGKCNTHLTGKQEQMLRKWAGHKGLSYNNYW